MRSATARESTRHAALFCVGAGQWDQTIYHHTHPPPPKANLARVTPVTRAPRGRRATDHMGPCWGDAAGSVRIPYPCTFAGIAPARTSGADDAGGGSVGSLGGGVGLTGGGSDGEGCGCGCEGCAEGEAPPRVGSVPRGGCGRCCAGPALGPAVPLGLGDAPAPPAPPSDASEPWPTLACRPPGTPCPPSGSATVPRRSVVERGAGFPPSSSLTLIQPAEAATASAVAIQTAERPGADNWRTSGTSGSREHRFHCPTPCPPQGSRPTSH